MDIDEIGVITDSYAALMLDTETLEYIKTSPHWEHVVEQRIFINRLMIPDGREIFRH